MSQVMDALELANELRLSRAAVKCDIQRLSYVEGRRQIAEIISDPSELWAGAKLDYVLRIPSSCGKVFSARMRLGAAYGPLPIHPDRRLRDLTGRERGELVRLLTTFGWRVSK